MSQATCDLLNRVVQLVQLSLGPHRQQKAPKSTTWVERLVHLGGQLMADPRHGFDVPVRSPRFGIAPRVALLRFEITRKSGTKALRTHEHTLQLLGALKSAKLLGTLSLPNSTAAQLLPGSNWCTGTAETSDLMQNMRGILLSINECCCTWRADSIQVHTR